MNPILPIRFRYGFDQELFRMRPKSPMVEGGPSDGAYPGGGRSSMELPAMTAAPPPPLFGGGLRLLEVN